MNLEDRYVIYARLEKQNGRNNQLIKAIEEMSELIKELTQVLGADTYTNNKNICDEIADAKVSIEQLERFFDPKKKAVDLIVEYKLNRLDMFYLNDQNSSASNVAIKNRKNH